MDWILDFIQFFSLLVAEVGFWESTREGYFFLGWKIFERVNCDTSRLGESKQKDWVKAYLEFWEFFLSIDFY